MKVFYYIFVWDVQEGRVVDSLCVLRGGAEAADDVSLGAIRADEEEERVGRLRAQYPIERYTFGGGYSSSLKECVSAFFGMEKDYDDLG